MSDQRQWWIIYITDYGDFSFYGTEKEADETRIHKADWEGGLGSMRPADTTGAEDGEKIAASIKQFRWEHENGVELEANELEAIREA